MSAIVVFFIPAWSQKESILLFNNVLDQSLFITYWETAWWKSLVEIHEHCDFVLLRYCSNCLFVSGLSFHSRILHSYECSNCIFVVIYCIYDCLIIFVDGYLSSAWIRNVMWKHWKWPICFCKHTKVSFSLVIFARYMLLNRYKPQRWHSGLER